MSTRKYPLAGCPLTGDEILKVAREKIASLSTEEATALLTEMDAETPEPEAEVEESIPKTAEDQETYGVFVYEGTKLAAERFNVLTKGKDALSFDDAMGKLAEDIAAFDAETDAFRQELNADPAQDLLNDMVQKIAEVDPAALEEFAAKKLAELGYQVKAADDDEDEEEGAEGVEDEEEVEEPAAE